MKQEKRGRRKAYRENRDKETPEEREIRLSKRRRADISRKEKETPEEKNIRLSKRRSSETEKS